jgi:hypothetical protein
MNNPMTVGTIPHAELPENDYVSPGLAIVMPDNAFPNMVAGDTSVARWPYLRRWVEQTWYTDRRNPAVGFASRDEASLLYNNALLFRGKPCLELGCWRGWSSVHLALGAGQLDIIDPLLDNPDFVESITNSCRAAGVLDLVSLHPGTSPGSVHALAQASGRRWSLIFVDADHDGDAPRRDAEVVQQYAADTAMVLFHDLSSPYVAAGLDALRNAGWRTMVYQTMQIMGVAWRGDVQPAAHTPDPKVFWTLPRHLASYQVSGWTPPVLPAGGVKWPGMTVQDQRNAAMLRAQAAEDDLAEVRIELAKAQARIEAAEATVAERDTALVRHNAVAAERDMAVAHLKQTAAQHDVVLERLQDILRLRDTAIMHVDAAHARIAQLGEQLATLTSTILRRNEAESAQVLVARRETALRQLVHWVAQRSVLLALLWRAPQQRITLIRDQAAAMGIAQVATDPFVHWLCRRRTLLGLLRRSAWQVKAAVSQAALQYMKD